MNMHGATIKIIDGNKIDCYSIANVSLLLNTVTQRVIIVITVTIFICFHLYTEYLKLCTLIEPCFWRTECCS